MAKNGKRKGAWAFGVAFAAFSGVVALGWLYQVDLWVLRAAQEHSSSFLDGALGVLSFPGGVEITGMALLVLLAGLFLQGRWALAGRILVVFVATGMLKLVVKLYLPQVPMPEDVGRTEDYAPLVARDYSYPYPSGHMLRSVIVFGALYLLSGTWFLRAGFLAVLVGIAANRILLGMHWASDVVGGVLLGIAALLWASAKEDLGWRSR